MNTSKSHNDLLKGKHIFLTGATGFIGSHLARKLVSCGSRVTILAREKSDFWRLQDIKSRLDIVYGDLANLKIENLQPRLKGTDIIYHLGASGVNPSKQDSLGLVKINVSGTMSLLKLADRLKVERFIYCGSCSEYGSGELLSEDARPAPICEYGASKLSAWVIVNTFFRKYGLPVVSLRPFTVYGPFEEPHRLVPYTVINALEGADIKLTGGKQKRDFLFIDDAIDGFLKAAVMPAILGKTFNLSNSKSVSVKAMVLTIIKLMKTSSIPLFGAQPYRENELWLSSGNNAKAKKNLNWSARISLEDGLKITIRWLKENRAKFRAYEKD